MSASGISWNDSDLTPAAKRLLDDILSDLRSEIVHTAKRRAVRYPSPVTDVGVRDVVHVMGELGLSRERERRHARGSLAGWLTFSGFLFVLTVMIIVLQVTFPDTGNSSILLNLAGTVSAALTAVSLAVLIVRWSQSEAHTAASSLAEYLDLWIALETTMRVRISEDLGESKSSEDLSSLIGDYAAVARLDSDAESELRTLLGFRNDIVHGAVELPEERLQEGIRLAKRHVAQGRMAARN
jgi:hypothetical protein